MGQVLAPSGNPLGNFSRDPADIPVRNPVAIPGLWLGRDLARPARPGIATGFAPLDAELPGGGWPSGALTEVLHGAAGIGELRLFFPALKALTGAGAPVFLLDPPWLPYAPALASAGIALPHLVVVQPRRPQDVLWACEQILKGLSDGALFAWPRALKAQDARRLQLAVEGKPVLAVLMRRADAAAEPTPAALRILLEPARQAAAFTPAPALLLRILKRRGGVLARPLELVPSPPLPPLPLPSSLSSSPAPPSHVVDSDSSQRAPARLHPAGAHA